MKEKEIAIKLVNVSKVYRIQDKFTIRERVWSLLEFQKKRKIQALENINLEVRKGEFFSIIGRNGSGKSTLLKIINKAILPDKGGFVSLNGSHIKLSLGIGFNPELTAMQNIYLNASLLGLTFKQIGRKFAEIINFAELHDFVDTKIKYYSSGMVSRLSFSIAIHSESQILLLDEFFGGVGDEIFRKKSEEIFTKRFIEGRTIIHVSHSLDNVLKYSDRVMLLEKGKCIDIGEPEKVVNKYHELIKSSKPDHK